MRRWLALAALGLTGCAGLSAALDYDDVTVHAIEVRGSTWRIFDKPAEGRMMITPTYGRSAANGFLSGLTLGAADTDIPKSEYQVGVEAWLGATGRRSCTVIDGYKLIRPQWEFKYDCPAGR